MDSQHREWVRKALEENERRLTAYVARMMGGHLDLARDVVQHAFLKLCAQDHQSLGDNVAAWLFKVCRNRALDEMRKQKISCEHNGRAARANHVEECPLENLQQAELLDNIQQMISQLPSEQREAIDLWSHGIRFREIGNVLGKSEGAVRISVHRAIRRLRESQLIRSHLAAEQAGQFAPAAGTQP